MVPSPTGRKRFSVIRGAHERGVTLFHTESAWQLCDGSIHVAPSRCDPAPNATRLEDDAAAENALPSAVDLVKTKLLDAGRNVEFGWLCFSVGDRQTCGLMANLTQRSASCGFVRPFAPRWPN